MAGPELPPGLRGKLGEVKANLASRTPLEWVFFWGLVPALLLLVYSLPQGIKDDYFILNTVYPWRVQTWFLSSYTHSQLSPHLAGNLAFYFIVLFMIFAFESDRWRFRLMAAWSFCAVPLFTSFLTIFFWGLIGRTTSGQGFSAIIGSLLAYAMFIFVIWGLQDVLPAFDHPELFTGSRARFLVLQVLLAVMVVLIMVMGLMTGIFTDVGGSVTNGIAHFGGYVSGLMVLFLFDESTARRRYFDTILGTSILIGIVVYVYYLFLIVRLVRDA
jgi:hypothetical protein